MPIVFTKSEVRDFLEEQGFDVSDEETLHKFIKDLKKVVKYESQRRRRQRLGHEAEDTNLDSTGGTTTTTTPSTTTSTSPGDGGGGEGYDEKILEKFYIRPGSGNVAPSVAVRFVGSDTDEEERDYSTSYYDYEEDDDIHEVEVGPSGSRPRPGRYQAPPPEEEAVPPLTPLKKMKPPKATQETKSPKGSGKLVMKRVTAARNETGDSVIEEEEVDLGRRRQQQAQGRGPQASLSKPCPPPQNVISASARSSSLTRPRTAPSSRTRPQSTGPRSRGPASVASSSQSRNAGKSSGNLQSSRPASAALGGGSRSTSRPNQYSVSSASTSGSRSTSSRLNCSSDELIFLLNKVIEDAEEEEEGHTSDDNNNSRKKVLRPPKHIACDPVRLYYWYKKNHWDLHSIPGEDRHMQLRWNVRAKTVGGHMY